MRMTAPFVTALAVVAGVVASAAAAENWRTYHNDRYGTTIDYPDFFKAAPPPDSNDGRTFNSADGAKFLVFASYNALDFDLAGFQAFTLKDLPADEVVTYQAHGDDWFVISGTRGGNVFYERHLLSHGKEMTEGFVISYPASLKSTYDPVAARMAKSFRAGAGFQTPKND
jgi:hypothetical protein